LTVVTAFFDIGTFAKGKNDTKWNATTYHKWMTVLKLVENPLIVFVDDDNYADYLQNIRTNSSSRPTRIIKLNRTQMWSFSLVPEISEIFNQNDYPKFYPNTVVPEYSAVMHAKYEVMELAILSNPFRTKYFCWLDIGLFRDLVRNTKPFTLALPRNHSKDSVSVNILNSRQNNLTAMEIVVDNLVWVRIIKYWKRYTTHF